ncbi:MAG: serine/threonine-protein kinase [Anaerolineae bacterium]|nr:serine/threonine-protein kinase [Anaerolineae bacterium]
MTLLADRYLLGNLLGEGGMGAVYRALDTKTEALVAIKKLRAAADDPEALERFNREAQALRDLNHPNIVKAYAAFEQSGDHYIVMEYVDGSDLADVLIREGRQKLGRVLQIGLELSDALTRAHYLRIIHRDLKPANVMLDRAGTPKLSDFGIAYLETQERVTSAELRVGTPAYMAPEALNGQAFDSRADLWGLGVLLYEMLIGRHPFFADTLSEVLINIFTQPLPDIESLRPDCPVALADLIYRLLERDPGARVSSARVVGFELEEILRATERQSDRTTEITQATRFEPPNQLTRVLNVRNNLPAQTTSFIGRQRELADLDRLLAAPETRLTTILGAGGMGKTRLALAAAHAQTSGTQAERFGDGVYLVELAPLTSADALLPTLANTVGYQFRPDEQDPAARLADFLREKRMLLVLDNFEHVLAGASLVNDLLRAAPNVKVLATSRERLNLLGETVYPLDGLDVPADDQPELVKRSSAAQLFVQSAKRARLDFSPQPDDWAVIAQICRKVDGLPLGIVLAAAWVQALVLREVLAEVHQSFDILETELLDVPERHRSIRAVFEYSWALMSEAERRLVAQLAVFRGGLSRRAGQEVAGAGLRVLAALVNKSILRRDPDTGSYHMHELLRQYALTKLHALGQPEAAFAAHSRYYLDVLTELLPALEGGGQVDTIAKLTDDFENVRAAWEYGLRVGDWARLGRALPALSLYFELYGQYLLGATLFSDAVAALRASPTSPTRDVLLVELLARASCLSVRTGKGDQSEGWLTELAAWPPESLPEAAQAAVALAHGYHHLYIKKAVESRPFFERAAALYRTLGMRWALAHTLSEWSSSYWYRSDSTTTDLDQARTLLREAYALQKDLGDLYGLGTSALHLGTVASYAMDDAEDARMTSEALMLFQQTNNLIHIAQALQNLGVRELMVGDYDMAHHYLDQFLLIQRTRGNPTAVGRAQFLLTRLTFYEGDFAAVVRHAEEGLALPDSDDERELSLRLSRADGLWASGAYAEALRDYERVDVLARKMDNPDDVLYALVRRGMVAVSMRDMTQAEALLGEAEAEATTRDDKTMLMCVRSWQGRLRWSQGKPQAARELASQAVGYFGDEPSWQITYSTDPWQMKGWAVEAWVTQADADRVLGAVAARTALEQALGAARTLRSAAHVLMVAAAAADVCMATHPQHAAQWLACVAAHRSAYAVDKARATDALALEAARTAGQALGWEALAEAVSGLLQPLG